MGDVIDIGFDYSMIDPDGRDDVKEAAVRIRLRMSRTVEDIIEIGRDLIAVKKSIGHGNFLRWIEAEFGMSVATADRFIRSCERFGDKVVTVTNMAPSVLYALAAPSTDDAVVEEVLERAANGEKITRDDVAALKAEWASERRDLKRQIEEARHKTKAAQATGIDYGQQIDSLRRELGNLRSERDTLRHELEVARRNPVHQIIPSDVTEELSDKDRQLAALKVAWNRSSWDAREEFLDWCEAFDRKAGAA